MQAARWRRNIAASAGLLVNRSVAHAAAAPVCLGPLY